MNCETALGEGRMALGRRWGTRSGTIAERCHRSWAHLLHQLPAYKTTARNVRRVPSLTVSRRSRAKTGSLFGSRSSGRRSRC